MADKDCPGDLPPGDRGKNFEVFLHAPLGAKGMIVRWGHFSLFLFL